MTEYRQDRKYLYLLAGPTAVGKTDLAIALADRLETEIISADSRQIYKELTIGTAKPSDHQLAQVKHHFINEISIEEKFTAADFEAQAVARLDDLFQRHDVVVCAGGTGLYLRALIDGLDDIPDVPEAIANKLEIEFEQDGLEPLVKELSAIDPVYAARADMSNPHRVMRALAVCRSSNQLFSSFLSGVPKSRIFQTINVCLQRDRQHLYERINLRVDQMMAAGLEDEVRQLIPFQQHRALQTVGYNELFSFFNGLYDRDRAIELIKQNSRRYAKRQMTWFRNQGKWDFIDADDEAVFQKIIKRIP